MTVNKYASKNVIFGGANYLAKNGTKLVLLKSYTVGDSTTAVGTTNNVSEGTLTAITTDFTSAGSYAFSNNAEGTSQALTVTIPTMSNASQPVAAGSDGGAIDLCLAITDNSYNVLAVWNETTNQAITSGNPITITPSTLTYTLPQPAAA